MLRLTDARTGQVEDIAPAKAGLLRVYVCAPTDPRTALLADLVRRTASVNGLRTRVVDGTDVEGIDLALSGTVDVHVGPVDEHAETVRYWVRAEVLDGAGDDPEVERLALLGTRYSVPARITADDLDAAAAELRRWRAAVAHWAEEPSKPMCAEVQENLLAAFADDLDTPRALQVLRDLEASELPAGCKFETAAWADRLLGLDLTREVGR